jgi:hypothetical protein
VLVVDTDALQAVDLLDLVDEPCSELFLALDAQDVVRIGRPVLQRIARANAVARLHLDVLAFGDQVLAREIGLSATFGRDRRDDDLALALGVFAHRHLAVDLADDGVIFRLACFEELGDARQPTGDVLHFGGVARDLRENLAGVDEVTLLRDDVRADGQQIARVEIVGARDLPGLARLRVFDRDTRAEIRGARLDDDLA